MGDGPTAAWRHVVALLTLYRDVDEADDRDVQLVEYMTAIDGNEVAATLFAMTFAAAGPRLADGTLAEYIERMREVTDRHELGGGLPDY